MSLCQLNQSNLLLTSSHGHKLQHSVYCQLHPLSRSHGRLCELVCFPRTEAPTFLERHTRLFVEPAI